MRPLLLLLIAGPAFAASPEPRVLVRLGDDRFRQVDPFTCLTYSPDGKHLATLDGPTVILWDVRDGRRARTIPIPDRNHGFALRFQPDGRALHVMVRAGDRSRHYRIDPATGAVAAGHVLLARRAVADFSPGCRYAVIRYRTGPDLTVYDLATGRPVLDLDTTREGVVYQDVAFRPDEKVVALLATKGRVYLFDLTTGARIGGQLDVGRMDWGLTFTPDGRDLLAAGPLNEIARFDAATGRVKWSVKAFARSLSLAPDGKTVRFRGGVLGQYFPSQWHTLDLATGRSVGRPVFVGPAADWAVHPTGETLATVSNGHISQWDLKTGRRLAASADPPTPVADVHFTPDGRAARGWADGWYEWDLRTGKQTRLTAVPAADWREDVVASRDFRWLACRRLVPDRPPNDESESWRFEFENAATGSWRSVPVPPGAGGGPEFGFLPTGRLLDGAEEAWSVYDPATGRPVLRVPVGPDRVAAMSEDGRELAVLETTETGHQIIRWDAVTGRPLGVWSGRLPIEPDEASPTGIRLSPDSGTVVIEYAFGNSHKFSVRGVLVFDTTTGTERSQWVEATGDEFSFLPDGRTAVAWSYDRSGLAVRDLVTGTLRRSMRGPGPVWQARLRSDGRALLVATRPYPVELWALPAGPKTWDPARADVWWQTLAEPDSGIAYAAILALRDHPATAVSLFKARMVIPTSPPEEWLKSRLAGLDAPAFPDRERASADLAAAGERVTQALRRALPGATAEARERITKILDADAGRTPDQLRAIRSCEVLEAIGTADARALLATWTRGAPDTTLTREAAASLRRLSRDKSVARE
jgi:WD40 repeat protein